MAVSGNTTGLKNDTIRKLESLLEIRYPRDVLFTAGLAQELAKITGDANREIAVYLDRYGQVREVMVGDAVTVGLLPSQLRRSQTRLSGLRCLHTHPKSDCTLSDADLTALKEYRLDAMVALGVEQGSARTVSVAVLDKEEGEAETGIKVFGPFDLVQMERFPFTEIIRELDKALTPKVPQETGISPERTLLIGLITKEFQAKEALISPEGSLAELLELAETAGANVVMQTLLTQHHPEPALFLGQGKVRELALIRQNIALDLIVMDEDLTPRQQNNLEESIGCRVIDRTALILQIFADRARTKEGKLQVELAQLNYLLPRLTGQRAGLSRLGGGIGTRGPGETKLESDRRRARKRIAELQDEIEEIKTQRDILRRQREQNEMPVAALVGYTNAGKSTLMNKLTSAGVLAEDKLFATLDPTTRRLLLNHNEILLTDTVGFIHKLPTQLVAAFRATLEEIRYADVLLQVIDAGSPYIEAHIQAVNEILEKLEVHTKPKIMVYNKSDLVNDPLEITALMNQYGPSLAVSAITGYHIPELLELISETLPQKPQKVEAIIPFAKAALVNQFFQHGFEVQTEYKEDGIHCVAYLKEPWLSRFREYYINQTDYEN